MREVVDEDRIVTVCRTGVRSLQAVYELERSGISAESLRGGMVAWSNTYVTSDLLPAVDDSFNIIQVRRLSKGCGSYIVGIEDECVVVDPSSKLNVYTQIAHERGFKISHVIYTHKHADHVSGAKELANLCSSTLHLSPMDDYAFEEFEPLRDQAEILLGNNGARIKVIHTPGHTPGSMCLLVNGRIFLSGDTLMIDSVGRPDLHESTTRSTVQLYHSCRNIFAAVPADTVVLPGHFGPDTNLEASPSISSSIGRIRERLKVASLSDFQNLQHHMHEVPKPPNYKSILRINSGREDCSPAIAELLEEGPNRCGLPLNGSGAL